MSSQQGSRNIHVPASKMSVAYNYFKVETYKCVCEAKMPLAETTSKMTMTLVHWPAKQLRDRQIDFNHTK